MTFARFSLSLVAVVGILAVALAGATIWLLITQPVTVADAVAQGEVSPLARALAGAIYDALQGILKYPLGPVTGGDGGNGPSFKHRDTEKRRKFC